ncbi:hypothetical protein KP509_36G042700 [Ceratopteris richardii]|uniref:Uncharacterized protein n=1 Tax=Ceratopteris richardii TaxID=49495 RepID=A0A8T2QCL4_CERRI|nr:hypothetical protein KP509_36G042700 [Ceratopteris richardii]
MPAPHTLRLSQVGHRHRGQVLYGSLCVQPLIILAVHTIVEDDKEELLIFFSNRAEARLLLRHYEAAEIDARVALQLHSDHLKSLSRRGRALHGLHRYKEANLCFKKALSVIAHNGNLETEKGLLRNLLKESSLCEKQGTTGVYNLVELFRDAKSGGNPICGECVGPISIGAAKDANMGRAIDVNRDVEPGELLIVSKAIAHAKINLSDLSSPLVKSAVPKRKSTLKPLYDVIVSQVLRRARSSELFQNQVSGLRFSTHGTEDISIPSIELYSSANKETDTCVTAIKEEGISTLLFADVNLELDAD